MKLALLNTSIVTATGVYSLIDISLMEARQIITANIGNIDSAIGHNSTAEIMSTLLGTKIEANRQDFKQKRGQNALVFKLKGRVEEGKVLEEEEIEEMGYKFQLLTRK